MRQVNKNIKNSDALKGFLFRAYNARRCINVGQALPDNRKTLIENNSCVVGPEQQLLRTSALFNCQVKPDLHTNHEDFPSPLVGEGASRAGEGFSRGFTLIELLVVVLIIGILAAVALPQYQLAVAKSNFTQAITIGEALYKAQKIYFLQHGSYATDIRDLDITFPNANHANVISYKKNNKAYLTCSIASINQYCRLEQYGQLYYIINITNGNHYCQTDGKAFLDTICKSFGGKSVSTNLFWLP